MVASADEMEVRRLEENVHRRAVDQQLRDELAAHEFSGPHYRRFEEELARYGMSVLRAWAYTGYIFKLVSSRGFALYPTEAELEELHRESEAREDLANMTVALALPKFRKRALIDGGWRHDGGASLPTYFMGACLYVFPNEFRRRRVQREKQRRQDSNDVATTLPDTAPASDPAVIATGNRYVRDVLDDTDERSKAILALTIDGYSQEEIVELLGESSVRAVEGVLYRWRTQQKNHAHRSVR